MSVESSQRRDDTNDAVRDLRRDSPELATLFDAVRAEFDAKVSALKAWGVAMTIGGGAIGGVVSTVAELARPGSVEAVLSALPFV